MSYLATAELGKIFGVSSTTIRCIQTGKTWKQAGGTVRKARPKAPQVPENIRTVIRAEYQKGVRGCGSPALAKKYDIGKATIWRIVYENKA